MKNLSVNKKVLSYIGIFFVVFVWGISPLITYRLNYHYSPTFKVAVSSLISVITFIILSKNHIKELDKNYIIPGVVTGLFLSLANISQKIGILYTTPAKYAFLENLSLISVPIVMYFLTRKKPRILTLISCLLCLFGVFVLNGVRFDESWGIGELLCAISGLLYGFNIAGTACFAKKLYAPLYLAVQSVVEFVISTALALALNVIPITDASGNISVIEKIVFPFDFSLFAFLVVYVVVCSAFCWIIRTNCMKNISATAVSIIMPFSAVVTAIASVVSGTDTMSVNMMVGGFMIFIAIICSSFD